MVIDHEISVPLGSVPLKLWYVAKVHVPLGPLVPHRSLNKVVFCTYGPLGIAAALASGLKVPVNGVTPVFTGLDPLELIIVLV